MQKNSTILYDVSFDEFQNMFKDLQNQISDLKLHIFPQKQTEFITRADLAKLLKCDISTIHNWTIKGKLKPYGIGNRVYYKLHEVEAALIPIGINKNL